MTIYSAEYGTGRYGASYYGQIVRGGEMSKNTESIVLEEPNLKISAETPSFSVHLE